MTPFVINRDGDHYLLVGECYVLGLMDGEAMKNLKSLELLICGFGITAFVRFALSSISIMTTMSLTTSLSIRMLSWITKPEHFVRKIHYKQ